MSLADRLAESRVRKCLSDDIRDALRDVNRPADEEDD